MKDKQKTKEQLISELGSLRQRIAEIAELEASGAVRKNAEKRNAFVRAIETTRESIAITTADTVIVYANRAIRKLFGYKKGELIGKHVFILNAGSQQKAKKIPKQITDAIKKKGVWEGGIHNKRKDGSEFFSFARISVLRDKKGRIINYVSTQHDITGQKKRERELGESEERYRRIFEGSPIGIGLASIDGKVVAMNKAMETITGYTIREFKKISLTDTYDNLKDRQALLKAIKRYGRVANFPARLKRKDGTLYDALLSVSRVEVSGEDLLETICLDISERKRMEDALQKAHDELEIRIKERTAELARANKELEKQKSDLEQKNVALSEMVEQIHVEKNKIREDIATNVNELIFPILAKLKLKNASRRYLDLVQHHLEELTSSFGRKITRKSIKLTPREIEICSMVKGGLTSKEISNLLNVSRQTVEKHRKNIRRKLKITNKSINLSSFLHKV